MKKACLEVREQQNRHVAKTLGAKQAERKRSKKHAIGAVI
jgi:hypothetical protein